MDLQRVRAHFDEEACTYDAQILRLVPQYREQGELILEVLPFDASRPIRALRPGGMFVNRELVLGATPAWTKRYEELWREHVALSGERDDGWFRQYLDEDQPASVEDHLSWLRDAAFVEVACHFRRLNFAVFGGSKH